MSKAVIGKESGARTTENRAADAAAVLNDGSFTGSPDTTYLNRHSLLKPAVESERSFLKDSVPSTIADPVSKDRNGKHRFGLPAGFVSRVGRYGRTVLFEDNIYRLPNGIEVIPRPPAGTLGSRNHQYALVTPEQYEKRQRGSVYVRTDGRIFDYAFDHTLAERDLFDTGMTIHDLERTGRYAPPIKSRSESKQNKRNARTRKGDGI